MKEKLICGSVADELSIDEEFVASRLLKLKALLPDLAGHVSELRLADLARIATRASNTARLLVQLKTALPRANIGKMVAARPFLLLAPPEDVARTAAELRTLLPGIDVEALVSNHPDMFNADQMRLSLAELQRQMPNDNIPRQLENTPTLYYSVQNARTGDPYMRTKTWASDPV